MIITKYAQSTALVKEGKTSLLIDPGKYNFDEGRVNRDFFKDIDVLFITHKHADHYDLEAVKSICGDSKPKIYTVREISEFLRSEGIESSVFNVGSKVQEGPFSIESIVTEHVVKGEKIDCFGVLITSNDGSFYHTSDTLYMTEKPRDCTVLMVPINNRGVCMSIDDAVKFTSDIRPRIVIPVHYDSPKDAHINPEEFLNKIKSEGVDSKIMAFGDSLDVSKYNTSKTAK
ncbi:MAG: MBL fold metallo-hydrolase [Nanoarchaeota archaeon]|nr:MBL fold metallo-hydrolase [Nanoarchaeota archaeon]